MPFPASLSERLIDEAHAQICCEALKELLESRTREVKGSRSPFSLLGLGKTRSPFASKQEELAPELQEQLRLAKSIRSWAGDRIREELGLYLMTASEDFRVCQSLPQLARRWNSAAEGVNELMIAFAREIRTLLTLERDEMPASPAHAFAAIRKVVASLNSVGGRCAALAEEFSRQREGRLDTSCALPKLPIIPSLAWLDELADLGMPAAEKDLSAAYEAARKFQRSSAPLLEVNVEEIETRCAAAQANYLVRYWEQLREHTRRHHVASGRSVDDLLVTLRQRQHEVEQRRQQAMMTNSPFSIAR